MYPWQSETNMHLPGGAISVAHQFLRCVLHQLAPNGVFLQMFQTHLNGAKISHDLLYGTYDNLFYFPESTRMQFFKSVTQALVDFNELNPIAPLQLLLEVLLCVFQVCKFAINVMTNIIYARNRTLVIKFTKED